MNKYQEALELLKEYRIGEELNVVDKINYNARLDKIIDLLQELVEKNERLVAHVKLAIKMLEENSPYAIETLKEVIEQDWSEDENNQSN